jgi:hypothetical protein
VEELSGVEVASIFSIAATNVPPSFQAWPLSLTSVWFLVFLFISNYHLVPPYLRNCQFSLLTFLSDEFGP